MKHIAYSRADKFVLAKNYYDIAPFAPEKTILTTYGAFYPSGEYKVSTGFLFSANFPAINTEDSKRASMAHDFFYNLMKDGHLSRDCREAVDKLMYDMLIEDDMPSLRAWYWYKAVRVGGESALNSPYPKIILAPPRNTLVAGHQVRDALKV